MNELSSTKGFCPACREAVPARICETDGRVVMIKECREHGQSEALISSDAHWYRRVMSFLPRLASPLVTRSSDRIGCPGDCGLCASHAQRTFLPVVPITSSCNLKCPVCYTFNKNRDAYHMPKEEFASILNRIRENDPEMQIINFTGGEPLLHPQFCDLVEMCRDAGIQRITVSTNGLKLLDDPELLPRLTELDARIVLSMNSFRPEPHRLMSGEDLLDKKLRILELLAQYRPSTTLLAVSAKGINDQEIGEIAGHVLQSDYIVSMEIHTVTYTGQNVGTFDRNTRLTTPDVIRNIAGKNDNISVEDFLPSPCAHPLCYSVCYLIRLSDGEAVPFTNFIPEKEMMEMLTGSLYIEPGMNTERVLTDAMNDLWSRAGTTERDAQILKALDNLLRRMFPSRNLNAETRRKTAEELTKAIYIHSHMDVDNLDLQRLKYCCGAVPDGSGRNIPTCAYNNFYRTRDDRFSIQAGQ